MVPDLEQNNPLRLCKSYRKYVVLFMNEEVCLFIISCVWVGVFFFSFPFINKQ